MPKISNKILNIFATIILSLVPVLLDAQQVETQISADTITVEPGGILNAEGNVIVQFGKSKVKAKALNFNQKTKEIKFTEIQEFQDGTTFNLSAENAVISSDLSDGIISTANLILDQSIKIKTDEVLLKKGKVSSVSGISRVTSC